MFKVIEGSQTGHCCFEATVVDLSKPSPSGNGTFEEICECLDIEDAKEIVRILNRVEGINRYLGG